MKRHQSRIATRGFTKLASAVKDRETQTFWYYMWIGSKWYLFDVRHIAALANRELPALATDSEWAKAKGAFMGYEVLLQRDLERVAVWCEAISARDYLRRASCGREN